MTDLWKVDLHCHSWFSRDCWMNPRAIIETALERGLDKLAITEHNNVEGARLLKRLAPDLIIVGEEIKTTAGEFIAYFVTEEVPKGLSPEETLARLRLSLIHISEPTRPY